MVFVRFRDRSSGRRRLAAGVFAVFASQSAQPCRGSGLGISRTVEMTADNAPRLWRRHLALLLEGFRAAGAHPLPEPPLAAGQVHGD
jgi:hypothetical protein